MLKGHLDAVRSSGFVDGWAYDTEAPHRPLTVALLADGEREVGWGLAHGYREDLATAGCSNGWCAFRLKLAPWPPLEPWREMALVERTSATPIARLPFLPYVVVDDAPLTTLPALLEADPTQLASLEQLAGCGDLFAAFIKRRGLDEFIRAAYVYLLHRPADESGLKAYRQHLKSKNVTPYQLLLAIADSEEYRARPRQHRAPTMPGFPFEASAC